MGGTATGVSQEGNEDDSRRNLVSPKFTASIEAPPSPATKSAMISSRVHSRPDAPSLAELRVEKSLQLRARAAHRLGQ